MPTIPSEQSPSAEPQAHQARAIAESFGVDAARYDRSRPRYPAELIAAVVAAGRGRDVLDVGIGTGIVARQFQAAGCTVLGVEPDSRMAEFARRTGTEVEVATFENWDPAGRAFDAVVAGQTWHWVDPVAGAHKAAAALRPGGTLALFWNVQQPPPALEQALTDVFRRMFPDSPIARLPKMSGVEMYTAMCDKAADGIRATAAFDEPQHRSFEWTQPYTRDEWLDYAATTGATTRLPQTALNEVRTELGAVIDRSGGNFVCHYTTVMLTATKMS
ncbi:methyltransferase domain-containing protein [Nocardia brasiliensis]|uniref:Methyltransferase domain-containing protein n=1 Tax=Nocardia brasiliensis TaxID=37326 RepID=A0A6G9XNE8_NOCBR|nr:class I SAM-dependent methyltransferase [Nocardia brasiliensis]QIS02447.1 methyltransferase domain-containing protein [Nocardia brasiliensis]